MVQGSLYRWQGCCHQRRPRQQGAEQLRRRVDKGGRRLQRRHIAGPKGGRPPCAAIQQPCSSHAEQDLGFRSLQAHRSRTATM
jgi:hypothetical protein